MNETKDLCKTGVLSTDNNIEIDYSSSSGIDSKRDSSDDNCTTWPTADPGMSKNIRSR